MDGEIKLFFEFFLFNCNNPYVPNNDAIEKESCRRFAEKIVRFWDEFFRENREPSREEMTKHLEGYLELLLTELDDYSRLVKTARNALQNDECVNMEDNSSENTNLYNQLSRIRTVYGIENEN